MSKPNYLEIGEAYDKLLLDFVKVSRENAELKRVRISESEIMEEISGLFLTSSLPTDHTEWSDKHLDMWIDSHVIEMYEDYLPDTIYELILKHTEVISKMMGVTRSRQDV